MKCPNCGYEEETLGATECSKCAVIFAKWQAKKEKETAAAVTPQQYSVEEPAAAGLGAAAVKFALWAGVAALLFFGGRAFTGWFGGWFNTAQKNAPAARQAAMQNINIPKVNLPQTGVSPSLAREISAAQNLQRQAAVNGSIQAARQNAASAAAASSAVQRH